MPAQLAVASAFKIVEAQEGQWCEDVSKLPPAICGMLGATDSRWTNDVNETP